MDTVAFLPARVASMHGNRRLSQSDVLESSKTATIVRQQIQHRSIRHRTFSNQVRMPPIAPCLRLIADVELRTEAHDPEDSPELALQCALRTAPPFFFSLRVRRADALRTPPSGSPHRFFDINEKLRNFKYESEILRFSEIRHGPISTLDTPRQRANEPEGRP